MGIADFPLKTHAVFKFLIGHVGKVSRIEFCLEQLLIITQAHLILFRIYPINEYRLTQGQAKALSLPNGIMDKPFMLAYHFTAHIHEIAGLAFITALSFDKCGIISVGNKTDILTVSFFRYKTVDFFRDRAHFILGIIADRQ